MKKRASTITLDQMKEKFYGKKGTAKRDQLEAGYEEFKVGFMIREARLKSGLTQQELADKVGTCSSRT